MRRLFLHLFWIIFAYTFAMAAIGFAIGFGCGSAFAQDRMGEHGYGHSEMHHIYKEWHEPSAPGVSCCNDADCRPTRAQQDMDGNWKAWNGHKWLKVPKEALLPPNLAGDGRSHLCELNEYIYCFSPAEPKS